MKRKIILAGSVAAVAVGAAVNVGISANSGSLSGLALADIVALSQNEVQFCSEGQKNWGWCEFTGSGWNCVFTNIDGGDCDGVWIGP